MSEIKPLLVTSEMMNEGASPLLFTGGACNIQAPNGPVRNPGRDRLATWLDERGYSYFDPQIHPITHGRDYQWELDGPNEKSARESAQLRIYEITSTTIGAVSMLEIMDDALHGRRSIVWFHGGRTFAPIGLGTRDELRGNTVLRQQVGELAYSHLLAYVNAGRLLRNELDIMVADAPHIIVVDSYEELKEAIIASLTT